MRAAARRRVEEERQRTGRHRARLGPAVDRQAAGAGKGLNWTRQGGEVKGRRMSVRGEGGASGMEKRPAERDQQMSHR